MKGQLSKPCASERNEVTHKESRGARRPDNRFWGYRNAALTGEPEAGVNHTVKYDPRAHRYHDLSGVCGEAIT